MSIQKYFIRKAFLSKTKPKGFTSTANPKISLDLNDHITDVVDDADGTITATTVDLNATGIVTIDSGTTTVITGGTGAQVRATTGEVDLTATAANVDINAATAVTIDSGTTMNLNATLGDIGLNATDGNIITAASLAVTSTASTGDHTIAATAGDVIINAGDDIILTPTANLTFTLAAIPTYPNDGDAGTGGLTAGQVYKTAAGVLAIKL